MGSPTISAATATAPWPKPVKTLRPLSLDSLLSFFSDTLACIAIFAGGGDPRHDALALELVKWFQQRIKGLDGWSDVRTRFIWVLGHLYARLGDLRRALSHLENAHRKLLAGGLPREALASALDVCLFRCRATLSSDIRWDNQSAADRVIRRCLERRPEIPEDQQDGLRKVQGILWKYPESVFGELGDLRRSFIAPVPGLLAERIGPPRG